LYSEEFSVVLEKIDLLISQLSGEEIVSKFELLKANHRKARIIGL
jgi:hypothetical protein